MSEKKITAKTILMLIIIMLAMICLSSWVYLFFSNKTHENTSIPFPYIYLTDIESEIILQDILQAIGHPKAVPIITDKDMFFAVLYNNKNQNENMNKLYRIASTFRIYTIEKDETHILSYQLHVSENGMLNIIFKNEIKKEEITNQGNQLNYNYTLKDMFDAIKNFPVGSYHEFTEYGKGEADLYQIRFNDGLHNGENFSYNYQGAIKHDTELNGIPFLITNMNWIKLNKNSIAINNLDPHIGFEGKNGVNVYYYP